MKNFNIDSYENNPLHIINKEIETEGRVKCIKDSYLYMTNIKTLTKDKIYYIIDKFVSLGYSIINDNGDEHWISMPGDEFFDEHFEKI